ncbi:hypothetical protein FA13DRAFT_1317580 [Coprinellus micaceus]|uniref:Uncharacterized protein n=1 Tax=Coprinellus micaceus TaxID=71717 RepID=A0A4Y7SRB0_COPMI|nr:hypothetical protein FA13DRAFT_1317580 [Coprinellus micaceus]
MVCARTSNEKSESKDETGGHGQRKVQREKKDGKRRKSEQRYVKRNVRKLKPRSQKQSRTSQGRGNRSTTINPPIQPHRGQITLGYEPLPNLPPIRKLHLHTSLPFPLFRTFFILISPLLLVQLPTLPQLAHKLLPRPPTHLNDRPPNAPAPLHYPHQLIFPQPDLGGAFRLESEEGTVYARVERVVGVVGEVIGREGVLQ